jgi:hypothetical protein
MTAFSRLSRFGMTFKPLTAGRGEELLTLYLAGFHAKTFPQQGKAQGLTESEAECGEKWRGWLAKYDPDSCSWKTAQCSLFEEEPESLQTLPRSGMTRSGMLWGRQTLVHRTSETESGSWPTPTVCGNYNRKGLSKTSGDGLATAVTKWPTPTANELRQQAPSQANRRSPSFAFQVKHWPTPQASDNRNRGNANTPAIARRIAAGKQVTLTMTVSGGQLNPTWVEWLMGWPLGWTDLKPSGTDRFRR